MAKYVSLNWYLTTVVALAANVSLGCSAKVADLGNNPASDSTDPIYSTDPPPTTVSAGATDAGTTAFRIVDRESAEFDFQDSSCLGSLCDSPSNGESFTVVSGRLFWGSTSYPGSITRNSIRSCNVDNCASSLITHHTADVDIAGCHGSAQYIQPDIRSEAATIYWTNFCSTGYMSSPMDGHSAAASISAPGIMSMGFAVDGGLLYSATTEATLLRCAASDCTNSLERFAMTPPVEEGNSGSSSGRVVAQDYDYLYLVDIDARLIRVKKDLNAPFEVLVHLPKGSPIGQIVLQGDSLYWVENVESGKLKSCTKTGCSDAPTTLMTGLHNPSSLAVDDSSLYVLEPPEVTVDQFADVTPNTGRILKCQITGCSNPEVIYSRTNEMAMGGLLTDDRFLYFSGNYCKYVDRFTWHGTCGFIAAIPK